MWPLKTGIFLDSGHAKEVILGWFLMLAFLHVDGCLLMLQCVYPKQVFEVLGLCGLYSWLRCGPPKNGYFLWPRSCEKSNFGLVFDVGFFACGLMERCLRS